MTNYWGTLLRAIFRLGPKPQGTPERPSPKIRITPEQADAIIKALKFIPGYENCFVTALAPSNSMDPGEDDGMYLAIDPRPHTDLIVGDKIWFVHPDYEAYHRIIELGNDPEWYAITKGDNNDYPDPVLVRPFHIKGVWRATFN